MSSRVEIEPCRSPRRFLAAQRAFYRGDPDWVPPLLLAEAGKLDPRKAPFFEHARAGFFLARRDGAIVGRISTCRDAAHDAFHGDRIGFFGHFEAMDRAASDALLDHARAWLRAQGATAMRGPVDLSTNHRCGLLIEGDPGPPFVMMPHNPPHYRDFLEGYGLEPAKDLLALRMLGPELELERLERIAARARERLGVTTRRLDVRRFAAEVRTLWQLYNRIWERNWGFVPMSEREFAAEAHAMKAILRPALTTIVERDGTAIAFAIGLPDVNLAIRACDGRLLPFGWFRMLATLRRVRRFRTMMLGVLPEERRNGVDAVLLHDFIAVGLANGWPDCEASWVLEDNVAMLRPLLRAGGRIHRRYRIYEMPLPGAADPPPRGR